MEKHIKYSIFFFLIPTSLNVIVDITKIWECHTWVLKLKFNLRGTLAVLVKGKSFLIKNLYVVINVIIFLPRIRSSCYAKLYAKLRRRHSYYTIVKTFFLNFYSGPHFLVCLTIYLLRIVSLCNRLNSAPTAPPAGGQCVPCLGLLWWEAAAILDQRRSASSSERADNRSHLADH